MKAMNLQLSNPPQADSYYQWCIIQFWMGSTKKHTPLFANTCSGVAPWNL